MEDINIIKRHVRKAAIQARDCMTYIEVKTKSDTIIESLLNLEVFQRAEVIMCYINFKNEVVTTGFIDKCLSMNKRVAVPVVIKNETLCAELSEKINVGETQYNSSSIIASELYSINGDLKKGTFGILEPLPEKIRKIDIDSIDMIIVPGVAFDSKKNRLGFGAGYYDRFLNSTKRKCVKAGICFEKQIVENVPVNQNDVPMDMIITEKRVIE